MVTASRVRGLKSFGGLALLVSFVASVSLGVLAVQERSFAALWLTPDQRGRLAYEERDFPSAADN